MKRMNMLVAFVKLTRVGGDDEDKKACIRLDQIKGFLEVGAGTLIRSDLAPGEPYVAVRESAEEILRALEKAAKAGVAAAWEG